MTATYAYALLTESNLEELSGYSQPGRQAKWLTENGIGFVLGSDGRPRTTWGAVDQALIGTALSSTAPSTPDLSWIK